MYNYVLAPAHACVVTHGKKIRRLRRSDRTDWFVPSIKMDANPKRNSQRMTSGFGISHSARKYIMPPVLTVTPNEIEQLIECVRSIGHTFTIPKIAITMMLKGPTMLGRKLRQKWKRRAYIGPLWTHICRFFLFFTRFM